MLDHPLVPPSSSPHAALRLAPHGSASIKEEIGKGHHVGDSLLFAIPTRSARSAWVTSCERRNGA
jgi:hypothetical protein